MGENIRVQHKSIQSALRAIKSGSLLHLDTIFIDDFYNRSCIYFLTNKLEEMKSEIVYIGQTKSLGQRLNDHYKNKDKEFNSLSFFFIDEEFINEIEEILISIWRPKYNEKGINWYSRQIAQYMNMNIGHVNKVYNMNQEAPTLDLILEIIESGGIGIWSLNNMSAD
jgi:hypothetical protein